jgi:hypothetical protein
MKQSAMDHQTAIIKQSAMDHQTAIKNESNATILILNTIQNVDFIM